MQKLIVALLLAAGLASAFADEGDLSLLKTATVKLFVEDVVSSNESLNRIISKYDLKIGKADIRNTDKECSYELFVKPEQLDPVLVEIDKLGSIQVKNIESRNSEAQLAENTCDLNYLIEQRAVYQKELEHLVAGTDTYKEFFQKIRGYDHDIYEKNKVIMNLKTKVGYSLIKLTCSERVVQDLDVDRNVSRFINMPGIEASFFRLENPKETNFEDQYLGASLRYMFTKGRTYFLIGVMKPLSNDKPFETRIEDIVTYGIGTDFYPRYLGQGRNTFFNPFSGFEVCGMILTSEKNIKNLLVVEPHFGMELFKNKYVILDTRVGYRFPLDAYKISTYRGLTGNLSLNIVF